MQGQVIAIALVVACGIASFVAMRAMYQSLLQSQSDYYARYQFADIFAELKRAPLYEAQRIGNISGVAKVESRVVADVTVDVPGLPEPAVGRLIGLSATPTQQLNSLCLRRGRLPGAASAEVIASEAFAAANHLELGAGIPAVINGRWQRLIVVGVAISPEYIYEIRGGGSIFPDNKHFGVLWMDSGALETALNMKGAFNSITARLQPGAREQDILEHVDRILGPYGGLGAYGRADQTSHRFISDEIAQNRVTSTILPAVFLGVAALLVHLSFTRLVSMQRAQIGVLKAFGYSNWQIGLHYIEYSLSVIFAGCLLGSAAGWFLGARLADLYAGFYRFPVLIYRPDSAVFFLAAIVSCITAILGALGAVGRAVELMPAEAMRPDIPPEFRPRLIDRLRLSYLSVPLRMVLRNLERGPWKALVSMVAVCCSVMIVVVEFGMLDGLNRMMEIEFVRAQREDMVVSFIEPRSRRVIRSLEQLPGVIRTQAYRAVPVRVRFEHRSRKTAVLGFPPDKDLRIVVDQYGNQVNIPRNGLLVGRALASALHIRAGQIVTIEVLEGKRQQRDVLVAAEVDDLFGISAYMDASELSRLLDEDDLVSGAMLQVDRAERPRLYSYMKRLPSVAAVSIKESAMASFKDTLQRSMMLSVGTLIVFASVIAVGMVYNGARVALSERSRELATLRILGFTKEEITFILLAEQVFITAAALPLGFVAGYELCYLLSAKLQTELYRLPLVVNGSTYAWAFLIVFCATIASAALIRRKIESLDIISVLKAGE